MKRIKIVEDLGYELPIKQGPKETVDATNEPVPEEEVGGEDE